MNVYFLVEGKRSERKLYPSLLALTAPHLQHVQTLPEVTSEKFILISGEGYPSILNTHLPNAIKDVESSGVFDYLVVVLDAEEETVEQRIDEVEQAAQNSEVELESAKLAIIVQNRCIETWLLGNRKVFKRQPEEEDLRSYVEHYNVDENDPEDMPRNTKFNTHAQFHYKYLKAIFRERKMNYTKRRPNDAATPQYLEQVIDRVEKFPEHLKSFSYFISLCQKFVA